MTPEMRALALRQGDLSQEAYARANPEDYAAYQSWLDWRPYYELDAEGTAAAVARKAAEPGMTQWIVLAAAGGLLLLLAK